MENLIAGFILLFISCFSRNNQLTFIMTGGCFAAWVIDYLNFDIALYYSLNALLLSLLAWYAAKTHLRSAYVYVILMISQMLLCILLVPNWGIEINDLVQFSAICLNANILKVIIILGVTGSDNFISNRFHRRRVYNRGSNNRRSSDNKD
jgi:hypothetical protein